MMENYTKEINHGKFICLKQFINRRNEYLLKVGELYDMIEYERLPYSHEYSFSKNGVTECIFPAQLDEKNVVNIYDYFISLAEYRKNQIDSILNE